MEPIKELKDKKITGWTGCKKIQVQAPTNVKIVGSQWGSCKSWWNNGGMETWKHYFNIEKSTDAVYWNTVGSITAKGGNSKNDYSFIDNNIKHFLLLR